MGGGKNYTFVYTELGVAMLSGLLNSDVAINVNIYAGSQRSDEK